MAIVTSAGLPSQQPSLEPRIHTPTHSRPHLPSHRDNSGGGRAGSARWKAASRDNTEQRGLRARQHACRARGQVPRVLRESALWGRWHSDLSLPICYLRNLPSPLRGGHLTLNQPWDRQPLSDPGHLWCWTDCEPALSQEDLVYNGLLL